MISISVVIATYNRASLLQPTLESLRQQQYQPGDEVIVVDNGSTDGTADVIARAASGFPVPLHALREPTPGKGPALNAGIAMARGSVLALTDDDVLVAADWLAVIRRVFSESSVALVGGRVDPRWECPPPAWLRVEEKGGYSPLCSPLALQHYGDAQQLGGRTAVGANLALRRSTLDELGGFAPDLARRAGSLFGVEDHDLCLRAHAAGYGCEYRPELRVRHWVPAERMRLGYCWRWFFWSGFANALLHCDEPLASNGRPRPATTYFVLRLLIAAVVAMFHGVHGRVAEAAESTMETAYALGYLTHRTRTRLNIKEHVIQRA